MTRARGRSAASRSSDTGMGGARPVSKNSLRTCREGRRRTSRHQRAAAASSRATSALTPDESMKVMPWRSRTRTAQPGTDIATPAASCKRPGRSVGGSGRATATGAAAPDFVWTSHRGERFGRDAYLRSNPVRTTSSCGPVTNPSSDIAMATSTSDIPSCSSTGSDTVSGVAAGPDSSEVAGAGGVRGGRSTGRARCRTAPPGRGRRRRPPHGPSPHRPPTSPRRGAPQTGTRAYRCRTVRPRGAAQ